MGLALRVAVCDCSNSAEDDGERRAPRPSARTSSMIPKVQPLVQCAHLGTAPNSIEDRSLSQNARSQTMSSMGSSLLGSVGLVGLGVVVGRVEFVPIWHGVVGELDAMAPVRKVIETQTSNGHCANAHL